MTDGYEQALKDVEELLSNSRKNRGGIHWGNDFIEGAHWGYELQDQIIALRANHVQTEQQEKAGK